LNESRLKDSESDRRPEKRRAAELEISDVRLLDKFQRLQELDKRDRETVIILIDGVLGHLSLILSTVKVIGDRFHSI
jgi:hypothetical protein